MPSTLVREQEAVHLEQILGRRALCSVDDQRVVAARLVLHCQYAAPRRKCHSWDVGSALLDALAMLDGIGADQLDVEERDARTLGDGPPCGARFKNRVHAVGYHD